MNSRSAWCQIGVHITQIPVKETNYINTFKMADADLSTRDAAPKTDGHYQALYVPENLKRMDSCIYTKSKKQII